VKQLLTIMAIIESVAGLALLAAPSLVSTILLATPLETAPGLIVARLAGAALLTLGIACWLARPEESSTASLIAAMLFYNAAAAALLAYARLGYGLGSVILWPAVLLHAALAAWCAVILRSVRQPAR